MLSDTFAIVPESTDLIPSLESLIIPGLGQMSQGDWLRGSFLLAGEVFLLGDAFYHWEEQYNRPVSDVPSRQFYRNVASGIGVWYGLGALFSAVDALYIDHPKNKGKPTLSAFQSLLFPGWGQMANGQHWKAAGMFIIQTSLGFSIYYQHQNYLFQKRQENDSRASFYANDRNRLIWWSVGALIFSVADAFVDCHLRTWDVTDDLSMLPVFFPKQKAIGIGIRISFTQK